MGALDELESLLGSQAEDAEEERESTVRLTKGRHKVNVGPRPPMRWGKAFRWPDEARGSKDRQQPWENDRSCLPKRPPGR